MFRKIITLIKKTISKKWSSSAPSRTYNSIPKSKPKKIKKSFGLTSTSLAVDESQPIASKAKTSKKTKRVVRKSKNITVVGVFEHRDQFCAIARSKTGRQWSLLFTDNPTDFNLQESQLMQFNKSTLGLFSFIEMATTATGVSTSKADYIAFSGSDKKGHYSVVATKKHRQKTWYIQPISRTIAGPLAIFNTPTNRQTKIAAYAGVHDIGLINYTKKHTWKLAHDAILQPRDGGFDDTTLRVLGAFSIDRGILLLYDASYQIPGHTMVQVGAALMDHNDPTRVIWRARNDSVARQVPLFQEQRTDIQTLTPISALLHKNNLYVYYLINGTLSVIAMPEPYSTLETSTVDSPHVVRHKDNPIMKPKDSFGNWESVAVFNPAAVVHDNKIHLFYRAVGPGNVSVIGYAQSDDGYNFENRLPHPVYIPRTAAEGCGTAHERHTGLYASGPGWNGSEDPRMTLIDGRLYMVYVAYNGYEQARLAITSISQEEFETKTWNWTHPQLMSPRPRNWGDGNKNSCILPEKVNGKYVVFHRIWPHICIDYVSDLNFGENIKWVQTKDTIKVRGAFWDSHKVGMGATPIKTKDGWLVIYQGVGSQDPVGHYKVGAMLLDLNNPSKVLYRSPRPILQPEACYELHGCTSGVAYSCGAVVKDDTLFIYYGGADTVTAVATSPLDKFLHDLKTYGHNHTPLLQAVSIH